MKESPIFLKTHDLLVWLLATTLKFPKSQRFVMALRVQNSALDFYEYLIAAVKRGEAKVDLIQADIEMEKLRHHLRLCRDMKLLSLGQFEHVARMSVEIGNLLGAWLKRARRE
ncbi:MAG TPA: diversity-generating retroelement protein Avd [bacterium]|nr:diversity-generating retroelement protein Avd [bacterium]HPG45512.1 diversity-generating retroelement protein Avd [bacterium]HPM97709.1 diversity-generating retroelement protein Avd [bacterium]